MAAIGAAYWTAALLFAAHAARRAREPAVLPLLPGVFASLHFC